MSIHCQQLLLSFQLKLSPADIIFTLSIYLPLCLALSLSPFLFIALQHSFFILAKIESLHCSLGVCSSLVNQLDSNFFSTQVSAASALSFTQTHIFTHTHAQVHCQGVFSKCSLIREANAKGYVSHTAARCSYTPHSPSLSHSHLLRHTICICLPLSTRLPRMFGTSKFVFSAARIFSQVLPLLCPSPSPWPLPLPLS